MKDVNLGYLLVATPATNVFIGGVMIVDSRGLPVEFRYSEPIQPTRIQQVLYGSVLSRYIKTEVILDSLLKSLETKPNLLIVNDDSFLFRDNALKDVPVARLTETKSGPIGVPGAYEQMSGQEFLLQLTSEGSPIRVQLPIDADSREPAAANARSLPDKTKDADIVFSELPLYTLLFENGRSTDILEPLKRVEKALTVLCQEAGIKAAAS